MHLWCKFGDRRSLSGRDNAMMSCFLLCNQGSLVGLCMQDYKSLCAVVMIWPKG